MTTWLLLVCALVAAQQAWAGSCPGVCQPTSTACPGGYSSGLCPGDSSIQCCAEATPSCPGQCQLNTLPCAGSYASGLCPGAANIQCCRPASGGACATKTLFSIAGVPVQQLQGETAFFWTSGLAVDADGSPNAYNPQDTGIDYLANAGSPGNWWGLSCDSAGKPYVQGEYPPGGYAPFPGYYVSSTSLENGDYSAWDPRRFANAVNLTFFVLPGSSAMRSLGAKLGDLGYLYWQRTGRGVYAIYADVGPASSIGEASVAANVALGSNPYNSKGRVTIGIDSGVTVLVFPGSGSGALLNQTQIDAQGQAAFDAWGGVSRFDSCILAQ